ncbi:hypothetical protein MMC21_004135 [Puttea exsequens]|nr:hypothetical protein [Puttea exsequens]
MIDYDTWPGMDPSRDCISKLIASFSNLKELDISLPLEIHVPPKRGYDCMSFSALLPGQCYWPKLVSMSLEYVDAEGPDLIEFLLASVPDLRNFRLNYMKLFKARWNGIVEFCKHATKLFSLEMGRHLHHLTNSSLTEPTRTYYRLPEDEAGWVRKGHYYKFNVAHSCFSQGLEGDKALENLRGLLEDCGRNMKEDFPLLQKIRNITRTVA